MIPFDQIDSYPDSIDGAFTLEEFWTIAERQPGHFEFRDGSIKWKGPWPLDHSYVKMEAQFLVASALNEQNFEVFGAGLGVAIPERNVITSADLCVVRGKLELSENDDRLLANPLVLFEVLSPETEADDRGYKFECYQTLSSVEEVVFIDSTRYHLECWWKGNDSNWNMNASTGADGVFKIGSLGIELSLADIYRRVNF